jgi:hypothetical protein
MRTLVHFPAVTPRTLLVIVFLLAALLAPAALTVAGPHGIAGPGTCLFNVVNRDADESADIVADLFRQGGLPPISVERDGVSPHRHALFDLAQTPTVPAGAYAGIVSSDRAIALTTRCTWPTSGGAVHDVASVPSTELWSPFLRGGLLSENSLVTIQNTDTTGMMVVDLAVVDGGPPLLELSYSILPGSSISIDAGRDPSFLSIPPDVEGAALRLMSETPMSAHLIIDSESSDRGVADAPMQPAEYAASTLWMPRIRRAQGNDGTRIFVVNPGSVAASAMLEVTGTGGSCDQSQFELGPFDVPAHAATQIDVAAEDSTVPEGCAASGVLTSMVPVLATVLESDDGALAGYAALDAAAMDVASAADLLYAPRWSKGSVQVASSVLDIMNPGTSAVTVTLTPLDGLGQPVECRDGCSINLEAGAGAFVGAVDLDTDLAHGVMGSLHVQASEPIVGVVADGGPYGGASDLTLAPLISLATDSGPGVPERNIEYQPLLMSAGGDGSGDPTEPAYPGPSTETPDASATATAPPTATGTPDAGETATPEGPPTETPDLPPTSTPDLPPTETPDLPPTETPDLPPTETPEASSTPTTPPSATAPPLPTATPLPLPATPTAAAGGPVVSRGLTQRVPPAVLAAALANPSSVAGWNQLCNPNVPEGPFNGRRRSLQLQNPNAPYHPLFNRLIYRCG